MNRTQEELDQFEAAAEAIIDVGRAAAQNVRDGDYDQAAVRYSFILEVTYSLSQTMTKAAINNLKAKHFPEDMLDGLPSPEPTEKAGAGTYL